MPKTVEQAAVTEHQVIGQQVHWLTLEAPEIADAAKPGQFVLIRVGRSRDPLLRRPFSIAAANAARGAISLICAIAGRGTAELARLLPGDEISVMGPLGNGFNLAASNPLLIGSETGLAPLLFLAQAMASLPVTVLMAGRTSNDMYWQSVFAGVRRNIHVATLDGSLGRQGAPADILPEILAAGHYDMIYASGPRPMLDSVARLAAASQIRCQVALEGRMVCGVGACLSCTCAGTDGRRRKICSDGPVFFAEEVLDLRADH